MTSFNHCFDIPIDTKKLKVDISIFNFKICTVSETYMPCKITSMLIDGNYIQCELKGDYWNFSLYKQTEKMMFASMTFLKNIMQIVVEESINYEDYDVMKDKEILYINI